GEIYENARILKLQERQQREREARASEFVEMEAETPGREGRKEMKEEKKEPKRKGKELLEDIAQMSGAEYWQQQKQNSEEKDFIGRLENLREERAKLEVVRSKLLDLSSRVRLPTQQAALKNNLLRELWTIWQNLLAQHAISMNLPTPFDLSAMSTASLDEQIESILTILIQEERQMELNLLVRAQNLVSRWSELQASGQTRGRGVAALENRFGKLYEVATRRPASAFTNAHDLAATIQEEYLMRSTA